MPGPAGPRVDLVVVDLLESGLAWTRLVVLVRRVGGPVATGRDDLDGDDPIGIERSGHAEVADLTRADARAPQLDGYRASRKVLLGQTPRGPRRRHRESAAAGRRHHCRCVTRQIGDIGRPGERARSAGEVVALHRPSSGRTRRRAARRSPRPRRSRTRSMPPASSVATRSPVNPQPAPSGSMATDQGPVRMDPDGRWSSPAKAMVTRIAGRRRAGARREAARSGGPGRSWGASISRSLEDTPMLALRLGRRPRTSPHRRAANPARRRSSLGSRRRAARRGPHATSRSPSPMGQNTPRLQTASAGSSRRTTSAIRSSRASLTWTWLIRPAHRVTAATGSPPAAR